MIKKQMSKLSVIRSLVVIAFSAALFSFSEKSGMESFTIFLNDKVLLQEYMKHDRVVKNIALNTDRSGVLRIHYNHCGKIGVERTVSILDSKMKALKTWRFSDDTPPVMEIQIKEIFAVTADSHRSMKLLYTSKEAPNGQVLAAITVGDNTKASLR